MRIGSRPCAPDRPLVDQLAAGKDSWMQEDVDAPRQFLCRVSLGVTSATEPSSGAELARSTGRWLADLGVNPAPQPGGPARREYRAID